MAIRLFGYAIALMAVFLLTPATLAGITVLERSSFASVRTFAGSNGATSEESAQDSTDVLIGGFNLGENVDADVDLDDQFSQGIAEAQGSLNVTDNVGFGGSTLVITANRSSSIFAQVLLNPASSAASATYNLTVRFRVEGEDANYAITGAFDPGNDGNTIFNTRSVRLTRPGTGINLFNYRTAGPLDQTGVLRDGLQYELIVRMADDFLIGAGAGADSSSLNLNFTVTPIPEPTTAALLLGCAGLATIRRRRNPRQN